MERLIEAAAGNRQGHRDTSPATPAIKTSFCVAAAAATPTIKLAVERMPSLARALLLSANAVDEVAFRVERKTAHPTFRLSDQSRPMRTSTRRMIRMTPMTPTPPAVTVAVAVAAEPAAEAAQQEDDEDDDEYEFDRHDLSPVSAPNRPLRSSHSNC